MIRGRSQDNIIGKEIGTGNKIDEKKEDLDEVNEANVEKEEKEEEKDGRKK